MKTIEESIAFAMDCRNKEIVKFLPYILQDFYEIGSSPEQILKMVRENINTDKQLNILDLGCGKGAVLIKIAKELNCRCLGIDAIDEFIDEAESRAKGEGIDNCFFMTGDIREEVKKLNPCDVIILGSIGPVLGDYFEAMTILDKILTNDGIIILDDGYYEDDSEFINTEIVKKSELFHQIEKANMKIVNQYFYDEIDEQYDEELEFIRKRCAELSLKHPDKKQIFEEYVKIQEEEYNNLKNDIVCSALIIKKREPGKCKCHLS